MLLKGGQNGAFFLSPLSRRASAAAASQSITKRRGSKKLSIVARHPTLALKYSFSERQYFASLIFYGFFSRRVCSTIIILFICCCCCCCCFEVDIYSYDVVVDIFSQNLRRHVLLSSLIIFCSSKKFVLLGCIGRFLFQFF